LALKKQKSEASLAMELKEELDRRAAIRRTEDEFQKRCDLFAKKNNLVTPEEHFNFVAAQRAGRCLQPDGKKGTEPVVPKKHCLNCGSINIFRQRDMTKQTLVWTDSYECGNCKETFVL